MVALIGDNGAGKSTLVRILSGAEPPDSGEVLFDGKPVQLTSPTDARELGIETVFQDLALAPHLSPVQNMYLGREVMRKGLLGKLGFMDSKAMRDGSRSAFDQPRRDRARPQRPGRRDVRRPEAGHRGRPGGRLGQKVIFLDEPTAALGVVQTQNVLDLVRRVSGEGIGVVFISHSMPHVMEVADRIQVMWRGRRVATYSKADTSMEQLVVAMTGSVAQEAS